MRFRAAVSLLRLRFPGADRRSHDSVENSTQCVAIFDAYGVPFSVRRIPGVKAFGAVVRRCLRQLQGQSDEGALCQIVGRSLLGKCICAARALALSGDTPRNKDVTINELPSANILHGDYA